MDDLVVLCLSDVNCARKTLHLIAEDDDGDCRECVESVSFSLVELRLSLQNSLLGLTTLDLSVDHWNGIYVCWSFFESFWSDSRIHVSIYFQNIFGDRRSCWFGKEFKTSPWDWGPYKQKRNFFKVLLLLKSLSKIKVKCKNSNKNKKRLHAFERQKTHGTTTRKQQISS